MNQSHTTMNKHEQWHTRCHSLIFGVRSRYTRARLSRTESRGYNHILTAPRSDSYIVPLRAGAAPASRRLRSTLPKRRKPSTIASSSAAANETRTNGVSGGVS